MRFLHLFSVLFVAALLSPAQSKRCFRDRPRLITINPPTLFDPTPFGYSHIALDTRNRVATVAGQVSINKTGSIVGTTLEEQLRGTERALRFILRALDADVEDIFKLNVYIRDLDPERDSPIYQPTGIRLGSPPSTLISTPALALEGLLVEIEVSVAVTTKLVRKVACRRARKQRG